MDAYIRRGSQPWSSGACAAPNPRPGTSIATWGASPVNLIAQGITGTGSSLPVDRVKIVTRLLRRDE